jgi:alanyl-tRNA synthetase
MLDDLLAAGDVSGEDAFKLHDTYGFPIDLTREIATERGVPVDLADFDARMEAQRLRSNAGGGSQERVGAKQEIVRQLAEEPTEFTGYEHL